MSVPLKLGKRLLTCKLTPTEQAERGKERKKPQHFKELSIAALALASNLDNYLDKLPACWSGRTAAVTGRSRVRLPRH